MRSLILAAMLFTVVPASYAEDSKPWQARYCEGMEQEHHVRDGGRVDCLSDALAIEVEWAKDWYHAVGQSLYYAAATGRNPGIILLCETSETHVEGLCRSYVYRLEQALKLLNTRVEVWTCSIDTDASLGDCFRPQIQAATLCCGSFAGLEVENIRPAATLVVIILLALGLLWALRTRFGLFFM
jgi:hypothetical protein